MDEYTYLKKIGIVVERKDFIKNDETNYDEFAHKFLSQLYNNLRRNRTRFLQRDLFKTNITMQ